MRYLSGSLELNTLQFDISGMNAPVLIFDYAYVIMEPGASATFIAGQKIRYLAGSLVKSGSYMHGYISPTGNYCGNPPPVPFAGSTGTGEQPFSSTSGNKFLVFPNPAEDRIIIQSIQPIDCREIDVKIYGLPGMLVMEQDFFNTPRMEFSLQNFPSGIYLVNIRAGKEVETVKLIKR
jgi:hypothetical protein